MVGRHAFGHKLSTADSRCPKVLKPEKPEESSITVFGAGAVGMSAVFAAAAINIKTIIVVDIVDSRLELAKTLGATHSINGKTGKILPPALVHRIG
jgi:aryl-alcohol dehydrogenase